MARRAAVLFAIGLTLFTARLAVASESSTTPSQPAPSTVTVTVVDDREGDPDSLSLPSLWPRQSGEPRLQFTPDDAESRSSLHLGDIPFRVDRDLTVRPESLWVRIRNGFGLPDLNHPLVRDWEQWYSTRPDYVQRVVERSQRYLYFIVEEVEKRNLPTEIALLPFIESAYNPTAYSRSHASGIWQFIPSTGKHFGLQQNWWQDERRDVLAATRAALDYLEKLYEMFGSWDLALAAYNWGEGAVGRAIARNEARGLRTDYVSLDMPAETRNYVPKLQAVKNLIADPRTFSLTLAEIPNEPYFAVVTTDKHIDVKLAARFANLSVEEFATLNPAHNRPVIRADGPTQLVLPADRVATFRSNLENANVPLASWQTYTVGRGERLEQIASRSGIALAELRRVNGLAANLRSAAGLTILVPSRDGEPNLDASPNTPAPAAVAEQAAPARTRVHVVRAGETLSALAERYGIAAAQLAAWNGVRGHRIMVGQKLELTPPMQAVAARAPAAAAQRAAAPRAQAAPAQSVKAGKTAAPARPQQATAAKKPARSQVRVAANNTSRSN